MRTSSVPRARATERRWRARPVASLVLRVVLVLVPAFAAVAAGWLVLRLWGSVAGAGERFLLVAAVVTVSVVVLLLIERLVRRAMPIVVLLRLSMVFPDRAPSRYAVARRGANPRKLQRRLEEARAHGRDDDPTRAAATILSLLAGLAAHDRHTRGHSERVGIFADMIAEEAGVDADGRERLRWAAMLHDIGKLEVPNGVLNKPSSLSAEDWDVVRRHPEEGARIAAPLMPWLGPWGRTIAEHHERWDGTGYPFGLSGREISLGARIVTVADAYETITASRPYRRARSHEEARKELARCAGSQFDPAVVRAFLTLSLGRLRWASGPLALLGEIPVVREAMTTAGHVGGLASGPAATGAAATLGTATLAAGLLAATVMGDAQAQATPERDAIAVVQSQSVDRPTLRAIDAASSVGAAARSPRGSVAGTSDRAPLASPDPGSRTAVRQPADTSTASGENPQIEAGTASSSSGVGARDRGSRSHDTGHRSPSQTGGHEGRDALQQPAAGGDEQTAGTSDSRTAETPEDPVTDDCATSRRSGLDRAREVADESARSGLDNAASRGNAAGCPPGLDGDD